MIRQTQYKLSIGMVSVTCLLSLSGIAHAQVSMPAVTFANGLYHYDYSISNPSTDELLTVRIQVLPFDDPNTPPNPNNPNNPVINVSAPAGFTSSYDPFNGFVGYTEDSSFFTAAPLSGFTYDSALAPMSSTFEAAFAGGSGITTTNGTTLAAVPEPGSVALLGAMGAAACFAMRRRRREVGSAQEKSA